MKKILSATAAALLLALAVPATAGAAEEPTPITRSCPGPNQYYGDPNDPTKFWECSNGVAYRFDCPAGLHWDTKLLTCNYPEQVPFGRSTTKAGTAHLTLLPLGLANLNAHFEPPEGIGPWADVTFTAADGTVLCTAQADSHGNASCDADPSVLGLVGDLLTGYIATYAGEAAEPSSGHGTIALL
ncbi:carbohydrate-binding module family 14 protein [Kitasatospora sp. NPDC002227]|uniref:carbohydrate-binding module family 14 protein n=1 Tax=Kitasatospora sp. NPDC002227 TaxID=3154773 RepID=UPI0033268DA3